MREHTDTETTPTTTRRLAQPKNARAKRSLSWKDTARVNEWCGWRMKCDATQIQVREFNLTEQAWS